MEEFNWEAIVDDIAQAFKLAIKEKASIQRSPAFKITAAIPFLAGCEDPDRCAYIHLTALVMASRIPGVFAFRKSDLVKIKRRMQYIANFHGGDRGIIAQGMALLELCMVLDYKNDLKADLAAGKANPADPKFGFELDKNIKRLEKNARGGTAFDALFDGAAADGILETGYWRI